ncbi:XkdF-like putative serine protease domain-containing protein [Candidatus Poribacteria bacterium]
MNIEKLSRNYLASADKDELHALRLRFCQAYDQSCASPSIDEMRLISSYGALVSEIKKRQLRLNSHAIDRLLFSIQAHERSACSFADLYESFHRETLNETSVRVIAKSDDDERIAVGIVYEPDETDAHGDYSTEAEIRMAAWDFMENGQVFKMNHQGVPIAAKVLESYVTPADFTLDNEKVKKGTWLLTTRVLDDEIWSQIKSGSITGYSMAGTALVI